MKKIRVTITMTEEEAEWLEQICFIEDELPWQKFINRVGNTVRRARHAFQQSVQSDEVPECDCNTAQGFHEDSCAVTIFYAALRR